MLPPPELIDPVFDRGLVHLANGDVLRRTRTTIPATATDGQVNRATVAADRLMAEWINAHGFVSVQRWSEVDDGVLTVTASMQPRHDGIWGSLWAAIDEDRWDREHSLE